MDISVWLSPFLVVATVAFAALLHASFQLGTSLLTMLSGHSLGARRSFRRLMALNLAYTAGAVFLVALLLAGLGYVIELFSPTLWLVWWSIAAVLNVGVGLAVWLFYYRRTDGTQLWLPRSFATYLATRTKKTTQPAESFTLGMGSVVSELPFIIAPLATTSLLLAQQSVVAQASGFGVYVLGASLPLFCVIVLVGSGHRISHIQRWRERYKHFLQFVAGSGLIVLGVYVFVTYVLSEMMRTGAMS